MLQIDDKVISLDLFEKHFCCNLDKCLGACCVYGDSGAPVEPDEWEQMENDLPAIMPYLTDEGRKVIDKHGAAVIDGDGELVTPLIGDREECAFAYFNEKGVCLCGIEKAWTERKTAFRKPVSCHLYPIRIKQFSELTALNYDRWSVCAPARECGLAEKLPVFRFLREPLIRKFGEEFYNQLEEAYDALQKM
jgi:hypothetical protein